MTPDSDASETADDRYLEASEHLIHRAMTFMGEHRAIQIASSVPIDVDSRGNIEGVHGAHSGRDIAESLLDVYTDIVGPQPVINIIESAVSGQLAEELKRMCQHGSPSPGGGQVANA